ncbi:MAG: polysaccharide biosynthesis protein [Peptococcaceae bacterium]|nr:polysaccharide biosynthesis protein [Peptococcaceae bacterium]
MSHVRRTLLLMLLDALLINIAVFGSYYLRFYEDTTMFRNYMKTYVISAVVATIALLIIFYFVGIYRSIWRYASVRELVSITASSFVGVVVMVIVVYGISLIEPSEYEGIQRIPHGVSVLSWLSVTALIGLSRFIPRVQRMSARVWGGGNGNGAERVGAGRAVLDGPPGAKRVLIIGAGDAGALALRELRNYPEHARIPVGFVDDSADKQRLRLQGIPVLGRRHDIPRLVEKHEIQEIIIALPSVTGEPLREIITICQDTNVALKILPRVYDIFSGDVTINKLRQVEVEDLLQRDAVSLDLEEMAGYLKDQVVLVTGAGGSIGSEICRQLIGFAPAKLVLTGHGENTIFDIEQELGAYMRKNTQKNWPVLETEIMDIRDKNKVRRVFERYRPGVVFHAAAHKHVPLMEKNPEQALLNNVLGTGTLAETAAALGVKRFVLISSDKAVNPTSVMGATKRVAEMLIQDLSTRSETVFAAVRFGNVLGSRGSVVPTFRRQIAAGGPVTVTDPEMTRYFMTIPEASQLVIQAGAMAKGGEIFILDMGSPVKIVDLARDLIRLSGLKEGRDIEIMFTGMRPGEKLYEELLTSEEGTRSTRHKRIFIAQANDINSEGLRMLVQLIHDRGSEIEEEQVIEELRKLLPLFRGSQ